MHAGSCVQCDRLVIRDHSSELHVIYQKREAMFHRDIQTPRRELKIRRAAEYF